MVIEINNLTTVEIDESFIKRIVEQVLKAEAGDTARRGQQAEAGGDVSIAFLGPGRMRKLNKQFRKKNRITDVLSFPDQEIPFEKFKIGRPKQAKGLGEIVICPREVKKNAKQDNEEFEKALTKVLIHGVLHLLGYDHEQGEEKQKEMEQKEKKYANF